ncbi:unnamed protein product [Calicophoron daubneyi]|uniref:Peptidase M1 leukotriene A4 hydrolase/aminopeptidase C-terminal domain-containing protein n=1 Tax=Calicophoron daubneyi TaxID=300641 RepID=A0AAV2TL66_CALDB
MKFWVSVLEFEAKTSNFFRRLVHSRRNSDNCRERSLHLSPNATPVILCSQVSSGKTTYRSSTSSGKPTLLPKMNSPSDPSSAADATKYVTKHLSFNWTVDFRSRTVSGTVLMRIVRVLPGQENPPLVLDINGLDIRSIIIDKEEAPFKIVPQDNKYLGQRLEIVNRARTLDFSVHITYSTSSHSPALQWLEKEMTTDGQVPFMYSQCQSIQARSLFPCQDTPGIKSTFDAIVTAPKETVVVMGGIATSSPEVSPRGDNWMVYHFTQEVPIPSYLVAIACGDILSEPIGARTTVWAERSVIKRAAYELAEMEKMLCAAEDLCGPYQWKAYGVLILPPSFPYGGMENPCLTFVSPTIIAGDRSLVSVVAHEIAHSWTGNLVTNRSWEHFWLNEGHTIYLERLIMEHLHGSDERQLLLSLGYAELIDEVNTLGPESQFTKLVTHLDGVDPELTYNRIPYEKGSLFLYFLEKKFGKDKMLGWLRSYLQHFGGKSLDTPTWRDYFVKYFGQAAVGDDIQWEVWLNDCGMPPWVPKFEADSLLDPCEELIQMFQQPMSAVDAENILGRWTTISGIQHELILRKLNEKPPLSHQNLGIIDEALKLSSSGNAEIRFEWSRLCLRAHYLPALDSVFEFLHGQGRLRYTRPLYRAMYEWEEVRPTATEKFHKIHRPKMHRLTASFVQQDLHLV